MQEDNLKKRIEAILANHTQTKDFGIGVKDDNGVITLIGMVPSRDVKQLVEKLVRKQVGVSAVINQLGIKKVDQDKEEPIIPLPVPSSDIPDNDQG
jgi:osmotically-inducible protein OsmY